MRKVKKPVFFIVFAVIALFTLTTIFGVHTQFGDVVKTYVHGVDDIRLGIDIQGGVDVTFEPAGDVDATEEQMDAALETIKLRLANQNISDSETYLDYKSNRIIVRFPWQAGEKDFNPEQAVKEVGMVVEGMNALPAALELAERYQVEMPIVQTVNAIVNEGMGAAEAVRTLMDRDPKNELPQGYEK